MCTLFNEVVEVVSEYVNIPRHLQYLKLKPFSALLTFIKLNPANKYLMPTTCQVEVYRIQPCFSSKVAFNSFWNVGNEGEWEAG